MLHHDVSQDTTINILLNPNGSWTYHGISLIFPIMCSLFPQYIAAMSQSFRHELSYLSIHTSK